MGFGLVWRGLWGEEFRSLGVWEHFKSSGFIESLGFKI